jgi:hypothetical protein
VYVVDPINRSARKYEVTTILDPLFYDRSAREISVENSVKASLTSLWAQAQTLAKIEIPAERSPSAVDYLANPVNRGRTRSWLDGDGSGWVSRVNGVLFVANASLNQALAAWGADRGPLILVLEFADGSKLSVQVKVGQNAITTDPAIATLVVVPESAFDQNGYPLPTQASEMSNYDLLNPSPSLLEALQRLANVYEIRVTAGCGGAGTRWRCSANGTCELIHPC